MRFWLGGPRVMGVRNGLSFGPEDFRRFAQTPPSRALAGRGRMEGGFIYVIKGEHGLLKIGVSTNPNAQLSQLRKAWPYQLSFEYVGALANFGYDLERATHDILAKHRLEGEWFDCPPEVAVAAINAAAHKRRDKIIGVEPEMVDGIIQIATYGAARSATRKDTRIPRWIKILFAVVLAFIGSVFYYLDSTHQGSSMYLYDNNGFILSLSMLTAYAIVLGFLKLLFMIF
jgi:T5orf172 domain